MKTKHKPAGWMAMLLLVPLSGAALCAETPSDIRRQIEKTEAEYFALYNKLNTDRQYDMVCRKDRPTGTNFAVRVCQPRYVETTQQANASERIQGVTHSASPGVAGVGVGAANTNAAMASDSWQQDAFRKNMLDVLQKSPELQALGQQRDALQDRLEELTKKQK